MENTPLTGQSDVGFRKKKVERVSSSTISEGVKQIVSLSLSLTHDSNTVSKQAAAGAESANPGSDDVNVVYRHQKLCRSVSDEPRELFAGISNNNVLSKRDSVSSECNSLPELEVFHINKHDSYRSSVNQHFYKKPETH
ncbi:hypothetical protein EB796_021044 [Bugula neritina]|uniref:Uncharacterized protein n=1 Tax=Bugula neritina TaxID=10212 RepID=A0A7J7J4Q9_BUGNE|nr:hypothetical protein EB796_021044 [Bugula neritina]